MFAEDIYRLRGVRSFSGYDAVLQYLSRAAPRYGTGYDDIRLRVIDQFLDAGTAVELRFDQLRRTCSLHLLREGIVLPEALDSAVQGIVHCRDGWLLRASGARTVEGTLAAYLDSRRQAFIGPQGFEI